MGEVAAFAQILTQTGILTQIQEHVRFARARFGRYEVIDFVAVLIGYMLSGEPTRLPFYDRLAPWASPFMALFGVGVAVELFFTLGPLVALALLYTRWIHVGALLLCLTMLIGLLWGFGGHFLFPGGDNTMTHATSPAAPAFLITSILVFIVPWAGITASISTFTQAIVGKSEENCRQVMHRARQHLAARRPFTQVPKEVQQQLFTQFLQAWRVGDMHGLLRVLSDELVLHSDGGGRVSAARQPISGPDKVARFLLGLQRKYLALSDLTIRPALING